jgi:O-antigen/teichoic acid export membrane protein
MWKKILATIGTRYVVAVLNLLLIFINGKVLGVDGMGLVGVISASANIAFIFCSVLCGNTIVYFMSRYPLRYVIWPAYAWTFAGSAIACGLMSGLGMLPSGFETKVYGLAVLLSLVTIHSRILLARDHIGSFNATFMIQGGLLFPILLVVYYGAGRQDAEGYVWALYVTSAVAWLTGLWLTLPCFFHPQTPSRPAPSSLWKLLKEMFVYGLWSSADNLAEGLTTRLNYFLMQRLGGYGQVGLLDAGTKISESVWHVSRSMSFISYSQVARTADPETQRRMTVRFFKLTYCALIAVTGIILLIPERVYTECLFTAEFRGIRWVIRGLAVGIVALGGNSILSHYFIGTGRVRYSTACSCIGLIALLLSGCFLIPAYGVAGSAISVSMAFSTMLLFSLTVFVRQTRTSAGELLPSGEDIREIIRKIRGFKNSRIQR